MVRTIEELSRQAAVGRVQPDAPLERYLSAASKVCGEGYDRYEQGDMEAAFIYLLRFVTLIFEQLQRHPDWRVPKTAEQHNKKRLYTDQATTAIQLLEEVKRELISVLHTDDAIRRREALVTQRAREEELRRREEERRREETRAAQAAAEARLQAALKPPPLDPSRLLAILGETGQAQRGAAGEPSAGGWGGEQDGRARSFYPALASEPRNPAPSYLSFLPPQQQYAPTDGRRPPSAAVTAPDLHLSGNGELISMDPEPPPSAADGGPTATDVLVAALADAPPLPASEPARAGAAPVTDAPRAERDADAARAHGGHDLQAGSAEEDRSPSETETEADDETRDERDEQQRQPAPIVQRAQPTDGPPRGATAGTDGGNAVAREDGRGALERERGSVNAETARSSAYPNAERPHTSFAVGNVPKGPVTATSAAQRDYHAVGAPPPPKLSARPAPTTQDQRVRLRHHLELRGFVEEPVPGDGNCQFHALVDQLQQNGVTGVDARSLRTKAVTWLEKNAARPMDDGSSAGGTCTLKESIGVSDWARYLADMHRHGVTWGDEGTLLAVSVLYRAEIVIISSLSEEYCHIVHPPPAWKVPLRMRLYLGHYHEFHYVSVRFA